MIVFSIYCIKKLLNYLRSFFVGLLGLEPRKTAPKTVVLPLHHRPISANAGANLVQILFYTNNYLKKIKLPFKSIVFIQIINLYLIRYLL